MEPKVQTTNSLRTFMDKLDSLHCSATIFNKRKLTMNSEKKKYSSIFRISVCYIGMYGPETKKKIISKLFRLHFCFDSVFFFSFKSLAGKITPNKYKVTSIPSDYTMVCY